MSIVHFQTGGWVSEIQILSSYTFSLRKSQCFVLGVLMLRQNAGKLATIAVVAISLILMFSMSCSAQSYEQLYFLQSGQSVYRLTLSVTPSLYEYYQQKSHQLTQHNFGTFVTPYTMELVAADIRSVFSQEEDFVNAVMMLVHQISYKVVDTGRYPVETVFEDEGDCDLLSYVAASLTKAQELDTVLFYYENENHMNIGVNLPNAPTDARTAVTYIDYEGTRYYMAECTGEDWQNGWRIGECPPELNDAQVIVVTLEDCEQVAPGQVSSSFGSMESSTMSLTVSSGFAIEGSAVVIGGQVTVPDPSGTVVLYAVADDGWVVIGEADLSSDGHYMLLWNPQAWGQYRLKASWSGDDERAGTDSQVVSIYIIPRFVVFAGCGLIIMIMITIALFLIHRATHPREIPDFGQATQPSVQ